LVAPASRASDDRAGGQGAANVSRLRDRLTRRDGG
jgi:hypothetical protein